MSLIDSTLLMTCFLNRIFHIFIQIHLAMFTMQSNTTP